MKVTERPVKKFSGNITRMFDVTPKSVIRNRP